MDVTTLFNLSYGLFIIGAKDGERNVGCVVNTVMQTTSNPVTLSVCINKNNFTNVCIKKTKEFAVSILSENIKENIISAFGFSSSKEKDKFSGVSYGFSPSGLPHLKEGVTGYIQCKVIDFVDNYTHTIFIAEVQEAENLSKDPPMTYAYYHKVIKGKAPKSAPTYVEEKDMPPAPAGAYKCSVCGYIYPGSRDEFERLPLDYKCPICTVTKDMFK